MDARRHKVSELVEWEPFGKENLEHLSGGQGLRGTREGIPLSLENIDGMADANSRNVKAGRQLRLEDKLK